MIIVICKAEETHIDFNNENFDPSLMAIGYPPRAPGWKIGENIKYYNLLFNSFTGYYLIATFYRQYIYIYIRGSLKKFWAAPRKP